MATRQTGIIYRSTSTSSLALGYNVQLVCRTVDPNIKPSSNIEILFLFIEIVVSKWSQNPYVVGSWSDPVVGTDHNDHACMASRIKNLFFGGEAAHGHWYGFMQGAYYSGWERANQIASLIQRENCEANQEPILSECVISQVPQRNGCGRPSYRP